MGRGSTREVLQVLNSELQASYEDGEPVMLDVHGRPKLHIVSFDPLAYERYGTFRNRAPLVGGSFVLRAFLSQPHTDGGMVLFAGVEAESQGYGFYLDRANTWRALQGVASLYGVELEFTRP